MDGFLAVIGPKAELWLVRTVGLLAVVIGATLAAAGLQSRVAPEIAGLGAGTAAVFLAVDLVGWAAGAIGPVYLADALVEAGILAAWASWLARRG